MVRTHVLICGGTGCSSSKSEEIMSVMEAEIAAKGLSEETEAKITVEGPLKSVCVYNNPYLSELVMESMKKVVGEENTVYFEMGMSSEDFSRFGEVVPAVFFRLGTRNEKKGISIV